MIDAECIEMKLPSLAKMRLVLYYFLYITGSYLPVSHSLSISNYSAGVILNGASYTAGGVAISVPGEGVALVPAAPAGENPAQNNNAISDNQQAASHVGTSSLQLTPQSMFAAESVSFTANPTDFVVADATVSPGSPAITVDGGCS